MAAVPVLSEDLPAMGRCILEIEEDLVDTGNRQVPAGPSSLGEG